jgi:hypothetical protein
MAYEELKKQYEEDCKNHERPWELWQYRPKTHGAWVDFRFGNPLWDEDCEYRRKEPPCTPEYFTGLDREKAVQYCGRKVGYSYDGLRWENGVLKLVDEAGTPFSIISTNTRSNFWVNYIKTIPETYTHPTITIEVNGKEYKLPRPEVNAPKVGTEYYLWYPNVNSYSWVGDSIDHEWLKMDGVHLTENRAQAWADWWNNVVMAAQCPECEQNGESGMNFCANCGRQLWHR